MVRSAVRNAADRKQVKAARLTERFLKRRDQSDIIEVLSSPVGRRFVMAILSKCGMYTTSYRGGNNVVYDTIFLEGQRSIGVQLLLEIQEADPEAYIKMLRARKDEIDNGNGKHAAEQHSGSEPDAGSDRDGYSGILDADSD